MTPTIDILNKSFCWPSGVHLLFVFIYLFIIRLQGILEDKQDKMAILESTNELLKEQHNQVSSFSHLR